MVFTAKPHPPIPTTDIISWIFDNPGYDTEKPIYLDPSHPSRNISHSQARTLVRRLVAGLRYAGLKRGDCVNIHSYNDIYYPILFLGVIAAGGIFTGTNPSYTKFEISHHIKTAKATFIISEPHIAAPIFEAARDNGISMPRIWIFDDFDRDLPPGMKSWRSLLEHGEEDWLRFDELDTSQNTIAARLFSSGTTGLPKAASVSHYNLVAQHTLVYDAHPRSYEVIRLIPLPLFHAAVGPMTNTSSLKDGIHKGLQETIRRKLPANVPFTQVWGMTELSSLGMLTPHPEDDDTGSIGRLLPGVEAKLIDDDGKDISAYDVQGELCLRGPTVISGYFENDASTREAFDEDGWFKTGDIAYCAKGVEKWYIVDRKKELIKVRGFQVAPAEIEGVLISHPQIIEAAVIGVRLPGQDGEHPRAYIVKSKVPHLVVLTAKDVKMFVASRLAKYKALSGGVRFVDAIPKNASGKILKRDLREQAEREIGPRAQL